MMQIVVTSAEELKAIIRDVLAEQADPTVTGTQSDNLTLNKALELLNKLGYPTSKAKIYKLTSAGVMPYRKYGNKLIFSRVELLNWVDTQIKQQTYGNIR